MRSRPRHLIWLLVCLVAATLAVPGAVEAKKSPLVVGSKKFTESVILGEIVEGLIVSTGRPARHRAQLGGTRVAWKALTEGEIDVYPEYTGTIRQELFPERDLSSDQQLRQALADEGISMSEPLGFENTYALAMKEDQAAKLGVETISDLKEQSGLTFGFSNEFMDRKDGWPGLKSYYELDPAEVRALDHDLAYQGVVSGDIDVVVTYSTDAAIEQHDLRTLKDDRGFFPDYDAVLLYRSELNATASEAVEAFRSLSGKLSEPQMAGMNKAVQVDGRSEAAVAANFLERTFGIAKHVESQSRFGRLKTRTFEHLFMVLVSMIAAIVIAVPLGVWAARYRRVGQGILGVVGILQTIPSLALLVFMIPLFGIGTWPAIAALFLYSLLPIVRNTYAGLKSISEEILQSARALGLERSAIMRKVELPIAMRSILAGIKTSVVINIGVATLGALIGAGCYGQPILTGIRRYDIILILEGAIPAAVMAIGAQLVFEGVERMLVPRGLRQQQEV
ncbi:MAG: glycine betaine ABC transporter substrate-binding protein [Bradymonadaceae bacterium]